MSTKKGSTAAKSKANGSTRTADSKSDHRPPKKVETTKVDLKKSDHDVPYKKAEQEGPYKKAETRTELKSEPPRKDLGSEPWPPKKVETTRTTSKKTETAKVDIESDPYKKVESTWPDLPKQNRTTKTDSKSLPLTETPTTEKYDPVVAATRPRKPSDPSKKHQKSGTEKSRKDRKM